MTNSGGLNFLNKFLDFFYVFNVFEILSVSKKYLEFSNLKWRIQDGGRNGKNSKIFKELKPHKVTALGCLLAT